MRQALIVARMTFLEARRNKVTWSVLFFSCLLVLSSVFSQEVSIAAFDRVLRDVGLASINIFGVLLAVFLGVSAVTREIERKTVYLVLNKPVGRTAYLLGKLAGVWLTVAVSLGMMLLVFLGMHRLYRMPISIIEFEAFWLMLMELLVIAAFSILSSTFTSSVISAFLSISLFVIGHLSSDILFFARKSASPLVRALGAGVYYALPDLERLNLKTAASLLSPVSGLSVLASTGYAVLYAAAFFALAVAIFARKDFK